MTLLRGRGFTEADAPGSPRVCVINETLAQKYFPNENPIGKRLEIGFDDPPAWREIIGIVADVKFDGLDNATPVQVFEPLHQWSMSNYTVALRTAGDPVALGAAVRGVVQKLDPAQPVHTVKPMTRLITESLGSRTFSLVLLASFAAVALALAAIGLYGVIAYNVAQRTREFGIRLALGATARDVVQLVLREGIRLIVLGIAVGFFAALALGQFVQTLLFGVGPFDPATFAAIAVLLGLVALAACLVPAWRATRVDPVIALRAE
jgi:putative ABC transport system permease protein